MGSGRKQVVGAVGVLGAVEHASVYSAAHGTYASESVPALMSVVLVQLRHPQLAWAEFSLGESDWRLQASTGGVRVGPGLGRGVKVLLVRGGEVPGVGVQPAGGERSCPTLHLLAWLIVACDSRQGSPCSEIVAKTPWGADVIGMVSAERRLWPCWLQDPLELQSEGVVVLMLALNVCGLRNGLDPRPCVLQDAACGHRVLLQETRTRRQILIQE